MRGLNTFIDQHPEFWVHGYKLSRTKLIIDADHIKNEIIRQSIIGKANLYGGDSLKFGKRVKDFIATLEYAKIEPLFVFGGANDRANYDKSLDKCQRNKKLLKSITKFHATKKINCRELIPLNLCSVMKSMILTRECQMHHCTHNSNKEIARLANLYQAPVLSNDSNFCLMDIEHGVIRFTSKSFIRLTNRSYEIECKLFKRKNLVLSYPGLDESNLPLLGVLLGNDYVPERKFSLKMKELTLFVMPNRGNEAPSRGELIEKSLNWMWKKTTNELIVLVASRYEIDQRVKIEMYLRSQKKFYDIPLGEKSFELYIRELCGAATDEQVEKTSKYIKEILNKVNSSIILNILQRNPLYLPPIIDDINLNESGRACVYPILGVVARLLRLHADDNRPLVIYDRVGGAYKKIVIEQVTSLPGFGPIDLTVHDLESSPFEMRYTLLLNCLNWSKEDFINSLIQYEMWLDENKTKQATSLRILLDYIDASEPEANEFSAEYRRSLFTGFLYYMYKFDRKMQKHDRQNSINRYKEFYDSINYQTKRHGSYIYQLDGYSMETICKSWKLSAAIDAFDILASVLNLIGIHRICLPNFSLVYNIIPSDKKRRPWYLKFLHGHEKALIVSD